jgi:tripartite ATP-independent transporter DctM subunit
MVDPSLAPPYEITKARLSGVLWEFLIYVCPLLSVIALVLGPIYAGVATPTEAAALGCVGAVVLAGIYGRLSWSVLKASMRATVRTVTMIFVIIAGSVVFGEIIAFSGAGAGLIESVSSLGLSGKALVLLMLAVLLVLGLFMDQVAMMMITLPIFMPIVRQYGIEPIWFAIMTLIALDIGLTSPPFGLLLFIMKGIVPEDVTMTDIYKAAMPFILCNAMVIAIIFLYPRIALYLPQLIR